MVGVRDWTAPEMWVWITYKFSESHAFNLTKLAVPQGVADAGLVCIDGENIPLERAQVATEFGRGGGPASFELHLHGKDGRTHRIKGFTNRKVILPFG